jgi:hypothetical protein
MLQTTVLRELVAQPLEYGYRPSSRRTKNSTPRSGELTLDSDDEMSAKAQLDFLDPQGEVVPSRLATVAYRRIQYEPLD